VQGVGAEGSGFGGSRCEAGEAGGVLLRVVHRLLAGRWMAVGPLGAQVKRHALGVFYGRRDAADEWKAVTPSRAVVQEVVLQDLAVKCSAAVGHSTL